MFSKTGDVQANGKPCPALWTYLADKLDVVEPALQIWSVALLLNAPSLMVRNGARRSRFVGKEFGIVGCAFGIYPTIWQ